MQFTNRHNEVIEFDPFDQASIDAAKAKAPGEGIGPLVAGELLSKIESGEITKTSQLPPEYQRLGKMCDLAED